jgi:RHS repeat-associated protein
MPNATILLAADRARSILWCSEDLQSHALAYSAYGYSGPVGVSIAALGFNGQHRDSLTGRYLLGNGYRVFSPVLMRFLSTDSLSPFGAGGVSAYSYCTADPVNKVDPSGHHFLKVIRMEPDIFTSIVNHLELPDLFALSRTSSEIAQLTATRLTAHTVQLPDRARDIVFKTGGASHMTASQKTKLEIPPLPFFKDIKRIERLGGAKRMLKEIRDARWARSNEPISSSDSTPYSSDSEDEMQRVNEGIRRAIYGPQL